MRYDFDMLQKWFLFDFCEIIQNIELLKFTAALVEIWKKKSNFKKIEKKNSKKVQIKNSNFKKKMRKKIQI